jgi:hypothetical protein
MAHEPGATSQANEGSRDKPRSLGSPADRPRVLAPAEDTEEARPRAVSPANLISQSVTLPTAEPPAESKSPADIQSNALAEALRVSRSALDGLLAKTHDVHEQSWRAVQSLFEELHLRLCHEYEARVGGFEKEMQERGNYQASALLERVDVEAEARLAARVDQALEKARDAEHRNAKLLDEKIEASRASLAKIADEAAQELERQKVACVDVLYAEAAKRLSDLRSEDSDEFEKSARTRSDALRQDFTKWADGASRSLRERLQHLADEITGQMEKKVLTLTEAAIARVADEVQAVVKRETSTYLIQALRSRIDQLADSLKE